MIKNLHHTALIVSGESGVEFYKTLGFAETSRIDRGYDQIVRMTGFGAALEIYVDSAHPKRVTDPEALGLRHLAFTTDDVEAEWRRLKEYAPEPIRESDDGGKVFFVKDPDGLPIEIRD